MLSLKYILRQCKVQTQNRNSVGCIFFALDLILLHEKFLRALSIIMNVSGERFKDYVEEYFPGENAVGTGWERIVESWHSVRGTLIQNPVFLQQQCCMNSQLEGDHARRKENQQMEANIRL